MLLGCSGMALAQHDQPAKDWYQKGVSKKNVGIDLYHSYDDLLKGKEAKEIVVAVIDGGTDINHPDLKNNIWHNPGEIPFNNVDDDNNGYVDDTVGWNFIGGADGKMVHWDNLEMTRLYRSMKAEFEDLDADDVSGNPEKVARYELYQRLKSEVTQNKIVNLSYSESIEKILKGLDLVRTGTGKNDPTKEELEAYKPAEKKAENAKAYALAQMKHGSSFKGLYDGLKEAYEHFNAAGNYHYNIEFDPRGIVGDNYQNSNERNYGNNNVAGPDASHGTHVAGIIAALRNNGIGMNGIADHVKIMVVRVVPDGDERDKDVANGIRYAVDNGAKIINMSFGKSYKWDKTIVNEAVEYAVSKGVLLIHAAGNDGKDNDFEPNYPNDSLEAGKFAATWMEIGASAPEKKKQATNFSNYGKNNVDVFAPGYQIYSTIPGAEYAYFDGTSMAAPVTSGVAALVWSYYPKLTAAQLKEILMKSATINKKKVPIPGEKRKTGFKNLSVTGGVVNVYQALKLAATY